MEAFPVCRYLRYLQIRVACTFFINLFVFWFILWSNFQEINYLIDNYCFQGRVFVGHKVSYLPQVDQIIVLRNGTISETGTYNELLKKGGDFAHFLQTYTKECEVEENTIHADEHSINDTEPSVSKRYRITCRLGG